MEMLSAVMLEMIGSRIGSHEWRYFSPRARAKVVAGQPKLPLPSKGGQMHRTEGSSVTSPHLGKGEYVLSLLVVAWRY
jgi:hypothetical protein